jgi:hypothetical protein
VVKVLLNVPNMTILSKKKVNQGKPEETPESAAHHGGAHSRTLGMGSMPNHSQVYLLKFNAFDASLCHVHFSS